MGQTFRGIKGSKLTHEELDDNFRYPYLWNLGTTYKMNMVVFHNDEYYRCIQNVDSPNLIAITNLSYWKKITNKSLIPKINKNIYISQSLGDDSTGELGNIDRPFETFDAANTFALANGVNDIYILDGIFQGSRFFKSSINYHFENKFTASPCVLILNNTDEFSLNEGDEFNVFGNVIFSQTTGYNKSLFKNLKTCYIEFGEIQAVINSKPLITFDTIYNDVKLTFKGKNNSIIGVDGRNTPAISLGYEGLLGYPTSFLPLKVEIKLINCIIRGDANTTANFCLLPFNFDNIYITLQNVLVDATQRNSSNCFGVFNNTLTNIGLICHNVIFKSSATNVSVAGFGVLKYVFSNGSISDKPLDSNTLSTGLVGTFIVDSQVQRILI